jgi:hypothetical protein
MKLKNWLLGATAAIAFGAIGSTTAQSAPLGNVLVDGAAEENSAVQSVAWVRRCHWHRGHRHCRRVWRDYGYGYGDSYNYGSPYAYGPYAYGPSFGFFFGGGGRHHRHGHHHHHGGRGHRH